MAVYEGARRRAPLPLGLDALAGAARGPRGASVPGPGTTSDGDRRPTARGGATSRSRARATSRGAATRALQAKRPSSVGIALAAIVIVFSAAFLSLSQSVRVAATGYDIVRLASEHDRLTAIRQDLQSDVERLKGEPAIRKQALDAGLGQLGAPLLIPAR
jgi:hypothetical protein